MTAERTITRSEDALEALTGALTAFLQRCLERALELPGWLVDGGNRFFWVYLLTFFALGVVALSIVVMSLSDLDARGVRVVGALPGGLPVPSLPPIRVRDVDGLVLVARYLGT